MKISRAITLASLATVAIAGCIGLAASSPANAAPQPSATSARTAALTSVTRAARSGPEASTILPAGATLHPGQVWFSPHRDVALGFSREGILEIWHAGQGIVWRAPEAFGDRAVFLPDGNLVVFRDEYPVWRALPGPNWGCAETHACTLHVQDNGNVTLREPFDGPVYWESHTPFMP